ncbi:MAG: tail fiber domain-containing protein [Candidatus Zixiibacteriota bacterium]
MSKPSHALTLVVVCLALTIPTASADVPQLVNYQGRLTNSLGNPVDTTIDMTFTIYDALSLGNAVWSETQAPVVVRNGLFGVLLGSVTQLLDTVFNDTSRYLGIAIGADPEMAPRTRLVTAVHAYRVSTVDGASGGNIRTKVSIGPGHTNTGVNAFVAGSNNTASGNKAVVSGGYFNQATGDWSAIGGGDHNTASDDYTTVSGGDSNDATRSEATVGGGVNNLASGFTSTIAGGDNNEASATHSTVSGGLYNKATSLRATIGGGSYNRARGSYSVVAGGGGPIQADSNLAGGDWSSVGGGRANIASDTAAVVAGGANNHASGKYSVVGGGGGPATTDSNLAGADWSAVGGGRANSASGTHSTVSGGESNIASASWATVGGGDRNVASELDATVAGGGTNLANAAGATVGGGAANTASGQLSTVPGGTLNSAAGTYAFAAGNRAKANHFGSVVISATAFDSVRSGGNSQMVLRADGGLYLTNIAELAPYDNTNLLTTRGGAFLSSNGTDWTNASDENLKENFTEVDSEQLLEKIAELPISQWNYKSESNEVTHIGPTAQDFHELFGLGSDSVSISTIDPSGIALAAIKALTERNGILAEELKQLRKRLDDLEQTAIR